MIPTKMIIRIFEPVGIIYYLNHYHYLAAELYVLSQFNKLLESGLKEATEFSLWSCDIILEKLLPPSPCPRIYFSYYNLVHYSFFILSVVPQHHSKHYIGYFNA